MIRLIQLELKKFSFKPHIIGLAISNIFILLLSVFVSTLLPAIENITIMIGLPEVRLDTITIATMLLRAALIVWEAVLIAALIIEEYHNKTMGLLFTYPVNRTKLIFAKLMMICGIMLVFHAVSSAFLHIGILLLSGQIEYVTYNFESISIQIITAISAILLGMVPLCVGMVKKSSIATIVSSIIIVALVSNSQGKTAGLMSIPVIAVGLGIIGAIISIITVRKMVSSDLYN